MHGAIAFGTNPFELPGVDSDYDHPADEARTRVILATLRELGWSTAAKSLEDFWAAARMGMGHEEEEEFQQCYPKELLHAVVREMIEAAKASGSNIFRAGEEATIRARLLSYWETILGGGTISGCWLEELCQQSSEMNLGRTFSLGR